ncbi:phosphoribosyltransferase family protein [Acetobacteraceae bacterium ESL0709]|nr:phosphoribosyltransferase family protein [Acetobacteraceae bacterium ESL0709]
MKHYGHDLLSEEVLLVPVPLHFTKLWSRRYNQAALLAQALGRICGIAVVPDALRRCRRTRALAHLSVEQRRDELKDAFQVNENRLMSLKDRHVILVDDILTTGATAESCVTALKKAGCRRVDLFVVARACELEF